jgi:hypothetical protein
LAKSGNDRSQRLKVTVSSLTTWIDRKFGTGFRRRQHRYPSPFQARECERCPRGR